VPVPGAVDPRCGDRRAVDRTWINPEAALPEPEAAANVGEPGAPSGDGAAEAPAGAAKDPGPDEPGGPAEGTGGEAQEAPVVDRVTEEADPEELPDEPGGLGISIDDVKD